MEEDHRQYQFILVKTVSIARDEGISLQDFVMDATVRWSELQEVDLIEQLIKEGYAPHEAVSLARAERELSQ